MQTLVVLPQVMDEAVQLLLICDPFFGSTNGFRVGSTERIGIMKCFKVRPHGSEGNKTMLLEAERGLGWRL